MLRGFYLFILSCLFSFGQENKDTNTFDVSILRGNVLPHTPDLNHLRGHPHGILATFSKQTHGAEEWHTAYDTPDYGAYFLYQNLENKFLGENYSIGAHYNFYFFNRNIQFKLGQGVAYATTPYDKETNSKNKAFGSTILANTVLGLNYKKDNLIDKLGIQTGFYFTHYSNGRTKSPNSGINTLLFNVGVNYDFDGKSLKKLDTIYEKQNFKERIKYNFALRSGFNESKVINSGQFPFYHISMYADKRIGRKSALQLGAELFLTKSFEGLVKYQSVAFPEYGITANTDYKRAGIFIGHELFVNRISLEAQLGYYIYDPIKNDIPVYDRVGMKYYITPKIFAGFTIKTHLFLAEALEFGIGCRL